MRRLFFTSVLSSTIKFNRSISALLIIGTTLFMPVQSSAQFVDVPADYWANSFIATMEFNGISSGCGNNMYCPKGSVTRAQMAVFLERGIHGGSFSPPAAKGNVFLDVSAQSFAASFIEQFYLDGITSGCGSNNYCPDAEVTRDQMAVFLLRAKYGSGYSPPPASGLFLDVSLNHWAVHWIEQLAAEGITSGCGNGNYCPDTMVTRDQMAVFLVRAFSLDPNPLIGSWLYSDSDTNLVLTFLDNTNYVVTRDKLETGDPLCTDGMESGMYVWNSETGEINFTSVIDTTGDCGLTSVPEEIYSATVAVDINTLTLTDDEGAFPLTRVVAANNPLIGSWYNDSENQTVITFLDATNYMVAQDIDEIGESLCSDGMESGTYTWNSETGEFSVTNANDTTGDCGLTSVEGEIYSATVTVSEDVLTLTDDEGSFPIPRVK